MKKLKISIFLLLLSAYAFSYADFSDTKNHWVKKYTDESVKRWIINGYSDNTFKPDNTLSTIEAYKIVFKIAGLIKNSNNSSDWKIPYFLYYQNNNYDNVYIPEKTDYKNINKTISREKSIYLLLKAKWINFSIEDEKTFAKNNYSTSFSDLKSNSSYALYVRYAKDMWITKWYDDWKFWYQNSITRAEFLKMTLTVFSETSKLTDTKTYFTNLEKTEKDEISYRTYSENSLVKWKYFIDSTKKFETWKNLYNWHWYFMQTDDYYDNMNKNQTPVNVNWSLWTNQKVYHSESIDWIKLAIWTKLKTTGTSESGNYQKYIDMVTYNENFYFWDIASLMTWIDISKLSESLKTVPFIWDKGVTSFRELKLVWNQVLLNNWIDNPENYKIFIPSSNSYIETKYIKWYIRTVFDYSSNFNRLTIYSAIWM